MKIDKFINLYNILIEETNPISNDINILKEEIEQEIGLENPSIKQIEELLNNPELFKQNDRLKLKIIKYLNLLKKDGNADLDLFDKLQNLLEFNVNLASNYSNEVCINLEDDFDVITIKKLVKYLENRTLDIDSWCNNIHTFSELFSAAKLDTTNEFITYLSNKVLPTIPATGKYELLFSILFKNGHRPERGDGGGDVKIGSATLEVKGSGARLGGQKAYGTGSDVAEYIKGEFLRGDKKYEEFPDINFTFNIGRLSSGSNAFLKLCNMNNDNIPLDKNRMLANGSVYNSAKNILKSAYKLLFKDSAAWEYAFNISNFIDSYLVKDENNIFKIEDISGFYNAFLVFALNYYAYIEQFDYFAIASKNKFLILSKESFKNPTIITNNIRIKAMPLFSESAGEQGKKVSIELIG